MYKKNKIRKNFERGQPLGTFARGGGLPAGLYSTQNTDFNIYLQKCEKNIICLVVSG